jgi:hypothetical protein
LNYFIASSLQFADTHAVTLGQIIIILS